MKFYQSLPCDQFDDINKDIKIWIDQNVLPQGFWNSVDVIKFMHENAKFASWCKSINLKIKTIAITWGEHANCCGPHIDTPPARFKLSWPVHNTRHTWNRWFQAKPQSVNQINGLGGLSYLNYNDLIEIDRREVLEPALIDAGVIHDVWCDPGTEFPRIGIQCQLFNEPQFI